jgi:hypothetical protein
VSRSNSPSYSDTRFGKTAATFPRPGNAAPHTLQVTRALLTECNLVFRRKHFEERVVSPAALPDCAPSHAEGSNFYSYQCQNFTLYLEIRA